MKLDRSMLTVVVCFLGLVLCSGCQNAFSQRFRQSLGFREANSARENPADQGSDPWINEMGSVTREEHGVQEVYDPLKLRNVFMSEKARDIERNLGFGG